MNARAAGCSGGTRLRAGERIYSTTSINRKTPVHTGGVLCPCQHPAGGGRLTGPRGRDRGEERGNGFTVPHPRQNAFLHVLLPVLILFAFCRARRRGREASGDSASRESSLRRAPPSAPPPPPPGPRPLPPPRQSHALLSAPPRLRRRSSGACAVRPRDARGPASRAPPRLHECGLSVRRRQVSCKRGPAGISARGRGRARAGRAGRERGRTRAGARAGRGRGPGGGGGLRRAGGLTWRGRRAGPPGAAGSELRGRGDAGVRASGGPVAPAGPRASFGAAAPALRRRPCNRRPVGRSPPGATLDPGMPASAPQPAQVRLPLAARMDLDGPRQPRRPRCQCDASARSAGRWSAHSHPGSEPSAFRPGASLPRSGLRAAMVQNASHPHPTRAVPWEVGPPFPLLQTLLRAARDWASWRADAGALQRTEGAYSVNCVELNIVQRCFRLCHP